MPTDFFSILFVLGIYYILPFVFSIIFPAFAIPFILKKIFYRKNKFPSIFIYSMSIIFLAFFANLLWEFALYNKIYYEWDRMFIPYSLFWHEAPSAGGANWIADGWTRGHLLGVWLFITISIYVLATLFAYLKHRGHKEIKKYISILVVSSGLLLGFVLVVPFISIGLFNLIFLGPSNFNYQEKNIECISSPSSEQRILYKGNAGEFISELDGSNLRPAFSKNLQLSPFGDSSLSPDSTVAVIEWGYEYWFHCLNSEGAFKIKPPEFGEDIGRSIPRSFPSWSPDSKKLIMNNSGDLTLVDLETKSTTILKSQVALRDNDIDVLAKDKDKGYYFGPYTVGDAHWAKNGLIYYTSFQNNTTHLHEYNISTGEDKIILSRDLPFTINREIGEAEYLQLSENQWASNYNKDKVTGSFLFNLKNSEVMSASILPHPTITKAGSYSIFSDSGKYLATSATGLEISPQLRAGEAFVISFDGSEEYNVTSLTNSGLNKAGINSTKNTVLAVDIRDFLDDEKVLIIASYDGRPQEVHIPRQINAILDFKTGELSILQDYPQESFENRKNIERPKPISFVK